MNVPMLLNVKEGSITPVNKQLSLFPAVPSKHPDLIIDSVAGTIIGNDLSQILSAYLIYFSPNNNGDPDEVIYPLSSSYRKAAGVGTEFMTFTHSLNCYCAADTVAYFGVEWMGDAPAGSEAQVDLVCTYRLAE
jgi:hypothetical protein